MRAVIASMAVCFCLGFLFACSSSPERKLQIACQTYADTLNALAQQNSLGQLSADAQESVDQVRFIVGPICRGEADGLSTLDALAAVEAGLFQLALAEQGAGDGA